jgi:hypothetical protein
MFEWKTASWAELAYFFCDIPSQAPMVALIEHVARAAYAGKIFGATSVVSLVVAQTPIILEHQEVLRVDFAAGEDSFMVTMQERGFGLDVSPRDPLTRWVPRADGIATFEWFLRAKRWD